MTYFDIKELFYHRTVSSLYDISQFSMTSLPNTPPQ